MLPAIRLIDFAIRQVVGLVPEATARETLANLTGPAIQLVVKHFTDHSQTLPKALAEANEQAWQAVTIALAGDGFLNQIKLLFVSADDKSFREQVRLFLQDKSIGYDGTPADFRQKCLAELNLAKNADLLSLSPRDVEDRAVNFQRYADPTGLVDSAEQVIEHIADDFSSQYPNLAKLLRQRPAGGPPLLVAAFSFFFRRAVETNQELFNGLNWAGLKQLSAAQEKAFDEVGQALNSLGDQFEQAFEQLDRMKNVVVESHVAAVETQEIVLRIEEEIRQIAKRNHVRGDEERKMTVTITNEKEREVLRKLRDEYRKLPPEQQHVEALSLLADCLSDAGQFPQAQEMHAEAARRAADENMSLAAKNHYHGYRDACELGQWQVALESLLEAARLDPAYRPFSFKQYEPKMILGAGGFGTVLRCEDRYAVAEERAVAVKTLHTAELARDIQEVFAEAHIIKTLKHPAIIGVRNWGCFDDDEARPFIVMDYFDGISLAKHLRRDGKPHLLNPSQAVAIARQIASGMRAAHSARRPVYHRDLKPDNILVRQVPGKAERWEVRLIDFGLAVCQQTAGKSVLCPPDARAASDRSYAGTFKYAPPEQKNEPDPISGRIEPIGPYSDVYTFGKTLCEALFGTTAPQSFHYARLPEQFQPLQQLLERCVVDAVAERIADFGQVLAKLDALDPRRREGEAFLVQRFSEILILTHGKPSKVDMATLGKLCKDYDIVKEEGEAIVREVRSKWDAQQKEESARRAEEETRKRVVLEQERRLQEEQERECKRAAAQVNQEEGQKVALSNWASPRRPRARREEEGRPAEESRKDEQSDDSEFELSLSEGEGIRPSGAARSAKPAEYDSTANAKPPTTSSKTESADPSMRDVRRQPAFRLTKLLSDGPEHGADTRRLRFRDALTPQARKVMVLANKEAQRLNHEYIGTEHILLGLIKEETCVAANILKSLDVVLGKMRLEVEKIVGTRPDIVTMGKLPLAAQTKKVVEYSIEEARYCKNDYIGTEHLLLGLLREQECVGAQVLMNMGLKLKEVRDEVLFLLGIADCYI